VPKYRLFWRNYLYFFILSHW